MTANYYVVKSTADGSSTITVSLPEGLLALGKLQGRSLCIKAGNREIRAAVRKNQTRQDIYLSEQGLKDLALPSGLKLQAVMTPGVLRLGPVIGVFVGRGYLNNIQQGGSHFRLLGLVEGNRRAHTLLYLFTLRDIDWQKGRITGTYYNYDENRWMEHPLPFPDVLYDRGGGFSQEAAKKARELRRRLQRYPACKKSTVSTILISGACTRPCKNIGMSGNICRKPSYTMGKMSRRCCRTIRSSTSKPVPAAMAAG
jgi:hypothetical protein